MLKVMGVDLIAWADQVEAAFGRGALEQFRSADRPLIQPREIEEDDWASKDAMLSWVVANPG